MNILKNILYNTTIRFTESEMIEVVERNDSGNTVKYIKFTDLCNAVLAARESSKELVNAISSPILPKNCLQYVEQDNGGVMVALQRLGRATDIDYGDHIFKDIGMPNLIFVFRLFSNTIQVGYVVATQDSEINEDTQLYHYPFSNVFTNGSICWGNKLPAYDELKHVQNVPEMFLSMPNNNHNYGANNFSGLEYRPLLEALGGKPFNEEWLKPMNVSYGTWFRSVSGAKK